VDSVVAADSRVDPAAAAEVVRASR